MCVYHLIFNKLQSILSTAFKILTVIASFIVYYIERYQQIKKFLFKELVLKSVLQKNNLMKNHELCLKHL